MTNLTIEIIKGYSFKELKRVTSDNQSLEVFIKTPNGFQLSYMELIEGDIDLYPELEDNNGWILIETKEELDSFLSKTKEQVFDWIQEDNWGFIREDYTN